MSISEEEEMRLCLRLLKLDECVTPASRKAALDVLEVRQFLQGRFGAQWKSKVLKTLLQMKPGPKKKS